MRFIACVPPHSAPELTRVSATPAVAGAQIDAFAGITVNKLEQCPCSCFSGSEMLAQYPEIADIALPATGLARHAQPEAPALFPPRNGEGPGFR
jgi:hypothetical protein